MGRVSHKALIPHKNEHFRTGISEIRESFMGTGCACVDHIVRIL
jgi:hypothetical protein